MNHNNMNTQIFFNIKYDLNGHGRSQMVTFMFILTLTYVFMDNFLSLFSLAIKICIIEVYLLKYYFESHLIYK